MPSVRPGHAAERRESWEATNTHRLFLSQEISSEHRHLTERLVPLSDGSNRRRSERVMLQIPVKVLAETPDRAQIEEDTHTLVVNAHGGLMKLKADLHVGQPIVLVNPQTGIEQGCRIVRVDQASADYFAVAFEFDTPSPKFWPVTFPPKDWEVAHV